MGSIFGGYEVHRELGFVTDIMQVMAVSPAVPEGCLGLSDALAGEVLTPTVRERIALAVNGASSDSSVAAALTFARPLLEQRGDISEADVARVRRAGWSEPEVAEIIGHVALKIFTRYFKLAAGTETDFPTVPLSAVRP